MRSAARQIPTFNLYGENRNWPTPDLLHWESVAERSRLHNWAIKPHRHVNLLQFISLRRGAARAHLDGKEQQLDLPCLLIIPQLSVHGFEFSPNIEGHVLTLASPLVKYLASQLGAQQNLLQTTQILALNGHDEHRLDKLLETIAEEYKGNQMHRDWALQSFVSQLTLWVARSVQLPGADSSRPREKSSTYFAAFNELVEARFREHRPLADYARELGISAPHLNSICRELANRSALQLIHERLLLEAKRNLIYTAMTVSEISHSLGFSEPAYFTRFFKRLSGTSPQAFRRLN